MTPSDLKKQVEALKLDLDKWKAFIVEELNRLEERIEKLESNNRDRF